MAKKRKTTTKAPAPMPGDPVATERPAVERHILYSSERPLDARRWHLLDGVPDPHNRRTRGPRRWTIRVESDNSDVFWEPGSEGNVKKAIRVLPRAPAHHVVAVVTHDGP